MYTLACHSFFIIHCTHASSNNAVINMQWSASAGGTGSAGKSRLKYLSQVCHTHTHIWLWEKLATMISNGQSSNCLLPVGNGRVQLGLLDPCIPVVPSPHLPHGLGQLAMPMTLAKVDLQEACRLVVAEHPPPKVNSEAMTTSISGSPSIFTSPMPSAGGSLSANMLANRVAQNGREWWCLGDVLLLMFFGGFLDVVGGCVGGRVDLTVA